MVILKIGQKIYNISKNNEFTFISDFNYAWTGYLYNNTLYSTMRAGQAGEIYKLNSENYFDTIGKYYDNYLIKGHNLYIDYIIYDNKMIFFGEKSCLLIYDLNNNNFKIISLSSNRDKNNIKKIRILSYQSYKYNLIKIRFLF